MSKDQKRKYYSTRSGNKSVLSLELPALLKLFYTIYRDYKKRGYFQESFGIDCTDGYLAGELGDEEDISSRFIMALRKSNLWPVHEHYENYVEEDLFDVVEFLFDHISKPIKGNYHDWNQCGMHYETFDKTSGQIEWVESLNEILKDYNSGYEITLMGEVLTLPEEGLKHLLEVNINTSDPKNIDEKIEKAKIKFRKHSSSLDDRRDAIRDLADVLEFLRPKVKEVFLVKDESDLFNIVNNFAIRHHNKDQKNEYDKKIWYSWMFYFYLASIYAAIKLIEKQEKQND